MFKSRFVVLVLGATALSLSLLGCVDPPPKLAAIPDAGLALRVHVFGASAEDAQRSIESVKQNNPSFSIVQDGGDGELVLGLDQDTTKCVEPTALCEYRVSYRIKNAQGEVVRAETATVKASSDHCSMICERALTNTAAKVVEAAAAALKGSGAPASSASASAASSASAPPESDPAKAHKKPAAKPDSALCSIGAGQHLPAEEAEKRAGQVEALKRLGVLDQEEFDCLRKAYLARL